MVHRKAKVSNTNNQSQLIRTFQNRGDVNKRNRSEKNTSGQSEISASKSSCELKQHSNIMQKKKLLKSNPENTDMDRDNFYHGRDTRTYGHHTQKK